MQQKQEEKHNKFGLVGKNISYSFSRKYFSKKFTKLELDNYSYVNFDIDTIKEFPDLIKNNPTLKGLNVTIPYKEKVIPYLDELSSEAKEIGAANTIKILKNKKLKGYNTDAYGFKESIEPLIRKYHSKALILGTGGASKAVNFALKELEVSSMYISRFPKNENEISYQEITEEIINNSKIIVNCTPLGTHPNIERYPDIPYNFLTDKHLLFDLIYNPSKSTFLRKGLEKKSTIINGLQMLELQAEKAWHIWND